MNDMISAQLREAATLMQKQIDRKINPAIGKQNPTERRSRIAAGMYEDGLALARQQRAILAIAAAHADNTLPIHMRGITTKRQINFILKYDRWNQDADCFEAMLEIFKNGDHYQSARRLLLEMIDTSDLEEERKRRELMNKEVDLIGQVAGYFPTPACIVDAMLDWVKITPSKAFDPTAGGGRILDQVRERFPDCQTFGVEISHTLAQIAQTKGHNVIQDDIYNAPVTQYDFIIMNPPFERKQDEKIVEFVYNKFLAPGGVLVSVMIGVTPGNSLNCKTPAFQEFVNDHGDWRPLPDGSFKQSKTGVPTLIVALGK